MRNNRYLILTLTACAGIAQADSEKLVNPKNNHAYQRFDTQKTWGDAKTSCANLDGYLATITSQEENDWIFNNLAKGIDILWLGGTDSAQEGTWSWITGEVWNYSNWYPSEPNNVGGNENSLCMYYDTGKWNDGNNNTSLKYLCEWELNQTPIINAFTATPIIGNPPLTVNFSVSAKDADGSISAYQWDFHGDGRIDDTTATGQTSYTYSELGKFKASVTVVDNAGAKKKSSIIPITLQDGADLIGKIVSYTFNDRTNTISIEVDITNTGNIPAAKFAVTFNLSDNGSKVTSTFKEETVTGLAVGETQTIKIDQKFDQSIYGKYVIILVNPTKKVAEINKTNNGARVVVQSLNTK